MKILIGTNLFGNYKRQEIAKDSWSHIKSVYSDKIDFRAILFADEYNADDYPDKKIRECYTLTRSSKDIIPESSKKLPVLKDILNKVYDVSSTDSNITHIGYINSDCIVTPNLIEYLTSHPTDTIAVSRLDIQEVEDFAQILAKGVKPSRMEIAGFDGFFISIDWWKNHNHLINEYLIGQPYYDQVLAGIISVTGGKIYNDATKPILCHVQHAIQWMDDTPEKRYNDTTLKNNPFDHLCFNMMHFHLQYNLLKRQPFGTFLKKDEKEQAFTDAFFDIMSLKTENHLKMIKP